MGNLADAIRTGVRRNSPTLARRLRAAEEELEALRAQAEAASCATVRLIPDVEAMARRMAESPGETLMATDPVPARAAIRAQIGEIAVRADAEKISPCNAKGHPEVALLRAAGAAANFCGSGGRI